MIVELLFSAKALKGCWGSCGYGSCLKKYKFSLNQQGGAANPQHPTSSVLALWYLFIIFHHLNLDRIMSFAIQQMPWPMMIWLPLMLASWLEGSVWEKRVISKRVISMALYPCLEHSCIVGTTRWVIHIYHDATVWIYLHTIHMSLI